MGKVYRRHENIILTALFLIILCGLAALRYDYYYDLNDDVLMKDIVAGVYTGTPESRNIQMLYPVSALISLFYRIIPGLPWYGLFLCFCQYGSLGLIVHRSLRFGRNTLVKVLMLAGEGMIIAGTMLEHLVIVQYSITCTMLAAAAVFLFYTSDSVPAEGAAMPVTSRSEEHRLVKCFLRKNILPILLITLAFLIRSEMVLLVLPLAGVAGLSKWGEEKPVFTALNTKKYFTVLGAVLICLAAGFAANMIAYGSAEWQKFTRLFDNRTELYDFYFYQMPEYGEHAAFYESIGLSESEAALLHNYNFGLDEKIDEEVMGKVAAYAAGRRLEEKPFAEQFANQLKVYYYKMTHVDAQGDFPWNALIMIGYAGLLGIGINQRKTGAAGGKLLLLFGVRSVFWMYLLMVERDPPRIAHSLYYMEFCILSGMLLTSAHQPKSGGMAGRLGKYFPLVAGGLMVLTAAANLPGLIRATDGQMAERAEANRPWQTLQAYCREHPEYFYFIDVYSTVSFSEKIFAGVDNRPANYDIMGGWASKSPLYEKKLAAFLGKTAVPMEGETSMEEETSIEGETSMEEETSIEGETSMEEETSIEGETSMEEAPTNETALTEGQAPNDNDKVTMQEALVDRENVFLITEKGTDLNWLTDYYYDQGREITLVPVETVAEKMEVYQINE